MIYNLIFIVLLLGGLYCAYKMSSTDWKRRIIPDVYLFPFMLIGFLIISYFPWITSPIESATAAAFGYALGAIVGYVFEKMKKTKTEHASIGMGDIKLLAAGGIWLGFTGLAVAIVISCIIGGLWGIYKKQQYVPFAPFFFIGLIIALTVLWFLV